MSKSNFLNPRLRDQLAAIREVANPTDNERALLEIIDQIQVRAIVRIAGLRRQNLITYRKLKALIKLLKRQGMDYETTLHSLTVPRGKRRADSAQHSDRG